MYPGVCPIMAFVFLLVSLICEAIPFASEFQKSVLQIVFFSFVCICFILVTIELILFCSDASCTYACWFGVILTLCLLAGSICGAVSLGIESFSQTAVICGSIAVAFALLCVVMVLVGVY